MSDIAIRVENPCAELSRSMSKLYPARSLRAGHIGARQERHDTTSTVLTQSRRRLRPGSAGLRDALVARFRRGDQRTGRDLY